MIVSLISLVGRYWWIVAIAALGVALKVQDARLKSALTASASMQSEITTMTAQNHSLKSASDECNQRVDQLQKDSQALQAGLDAATRRADAIAAEGVQAATDTLAHLPTGDCESIMRYGHQEAAGFKW
jgi:peptidoglycan hydrolase CwlO-like protein